MDIEGVLEGAQEQNHLDALEVRLYNALIFGQSEEVIEIFRLVSKKWLAESERIELKKREAEAQFKFKQVDMGETVESQEEIEEQEFLDFFATKNEFQSEAEGIPEAIDGAKEPSKDSLAKYQKFVEMLFYEKNLKKLLLGNATKWARDLTRGAVEILQQLSKWQPPTPSLCQREKYNDPIPINFYSLNKKNKYIFRFDQWTVFF